MSLVYVMLLALCGLTLIVFLAGFSKRPPDRIRSLKDRFIVLSRLTRPQAEVELLDRVESLAEKFPNQTYIWYLEWLVTDLERAKR